MNSINKNISIILPTLNEKENLENLIPDFILNLEENNYENYEILVIDDNSIDGTKDYIDRLQKLNSKIKIIVRKENPSLPLSILTGIENSEYENVMWLDADGSMPASDSLKLINKFFVNSRTVIVGSRFTDGGAYKGVKDLSSNSFFKAIKNVQKSNDSVLGMIFSIFFNKVLKLLLKTNVKDLTSGFIVISKQDINKDIFSKSDYGEYFIYLINDLTQKKIDINEIGYICETRIHGESKTASSFIQLIKRGIPYIKVAIKCRINKYEDIR